MVVRYPRAGRNVLDRVSFALGAPVTFVVGENGAGKTTTFRVALGAIRPVSGTVRLDAPGRPGGVGYCPQELDLPGHVRLREYVEYLGWLRGMPSSSVRDEVETALRLVGLNDVADEKIGTFSGGMRRRIGLAQAILGHPRVIFLDEPTASLDPASRVLVRDSLANMAETSRLIISTHLVEDIGMLGEDNDLLVLADGHIRYAGPEHGLDRDVPAVQRASALESALIHAMRSHPR